MARSRARERSERREARNEYIGAFIVLPLARQLLSQFQLFDLGLDEKLRTALVAGIGSSMTTGFISDSLHGASVGAVGAYSWDAKGLLANLFGKK